MLESSCEGRGRRYGWRRNDYVTEEKKAKERREERGVKLDEVRVQGE